MAYSTCPGQDRRFWRPEDIFEAPCPECSRQLEFWKDDVRVFCPGCGAPAVNPRFDPGCARWCAYAVECLGQLARADAGAEVVKQRIEASLRAQAGAGDERIRHAVAVADCAYQLAADQGVNTMLVVAAALVGAVNPERARQALESAVSDSTTVAAVESVLNDPASAEARIIRRARDLVNIG